MAEAHKQSAFDVHLTRDRGWASGDAHGNRQSTSQKESRSIRQSILDQREYEIEKLLDMGAAEEGSLLFRARWNGYRPQDNNWEPEEDLPQEMVRAASLRTNLAHQREIRGSKR